jgi:hypothetical protein
MSDNVNASPLTVNFINPVLFTTQNDVTASRADNTVYQNTSGKPMFIAVQVAVSGTGLVALTSDANPAPTIILDFTSLATGIACVRGIIANNNYYKVNIAAGSGITSWIETT